MADTFRTQAHLLNNTFPDNQPDGAITAGDMRDFVKSAPFLQPAAWDFHLDSNYTSGSPRTILAGVRTQITINGGNGNFGHPTDANGDHGEFWVHSGSPTGDDYIQPSGLNDFGLVRLAFQAQHTGSIGSDTAYLSLELDVGGGSFPVIYQDDRVMVRGTNNPQWFNFVMPLFSGPDFQSNGGRLFVTPSHDCEFWDFAFTGVRIYGANPAGDPSSVLQAGQ